MKKALAISFLFGFLATPAYARAPSKSHIKSRIKSGERRLKYCRRQTAEAPTALASLMKRRVTAHEQSLQGFRQALKFLERGDDQESARLYQTASQWRTWSFELEKWYRVASDNLRLQTSDAPDDKLRADVRRDMLALSERVRRAYEAVAGQGQNGLPSPEDVHNLQRVVTAPLQQMSYLRWVPSLIQIREYIKRRQYREKYEAIKPLYDERLRLQDQIIQVALRRAQLAGQEATRQETLELEKMRKALDRQVRGWEAQLKFAKQEVEFKARLAEAGDEVRPLLEEIHRYRREAATIAIKLTSVEDDKSPENIMLKARAGGLREKADALAELVDMRNDLGELAEKIGNAAEQPRVGAALDRVRKQIAECETLIRQSAEAAEQSVLQKARAETLQRRADKLADGVGDLAQIAEELIEALGEIREKLAEEFGVDELQEELAGVADEFRELRGLLADELPALARVEKLLTATEKLAAAGRELWLKNDKAGAESTFLDAWLRARIVSDLTQLLRRRQKMLELAATLPAGALHDEFQQAWDLYQQASDKLVKLRVEAGEHLLAGTLSKVRREIEPAESAERRARNRMRGRHRDATRRPAPPKQSDERPTRTRPAEEDNLF